MVPKWYRGPRRWRAICNIKLLLYYSNSNCSDKSEIEDISRYVVPYTGKRHNTSQANGDAFQNINMKWVKTWHDIWFLNNMYNLTHINEDIIWFLNDMYHLTCYTFIFTSTKQNTTNVKTEIKITTNSLLINSFIKCSYNQRSTKRAKTIPMMTMMTIMYKMFL